MKEKHPESETTCIYCITGQQHPRLARGETYTCGYKPYRCEVCNYSTTTKGNLSIHMQSDKHLNNMQELQNGVPSNAGSTAASIVDKISQVNNGPGGLGGPGGPSPGSVTLPPTMSPNKTQSPSPKPTWRCDVCNYDTNVARNLRIHMTSEKHTHNMMALSQQNVKSMHQLSVIQQMMDPMKLGGLLAGANSGNPPSTSEAALADLAFNQAVLAQMMGAASASGSAGGPAGQPDLNLAAIAAAAAGSGSLGGPGGLPGLPNLPGLPGLSGLPGLPALPLLPGMSEAESPEVLQEKQNQEDQNAKTMFSCCVCRDFGCDSIDDLSIHLNIDRSRTREHEVSLDF